MRHPAKPAVSPSNDAARSTDPSDVPAHVVPAHVALALRVGGLAASRMWVPKAFSEVCRALPDATDAASAVIILTGSVEGGVLASDPQAGWLGEVQRRAGTGPLGYALRSGRAMVTPDLTRVGPPELAAAAAESGLRTSVVVPLVMEDRGLGGVQLLGDTRRPVGAEHIELLRPLVAALTARLMDVLVIGELSRDAGRAVPAPVPAPAASGPRPEVQPPDTPSEDDSEHRVDEESGDIGWFGTVEPQRAASLDGAER